MKVLLLILFLSGAIFLVVRQGVIFHGMARAVSAGPVPTITSEKLIQMQQKADLVLLDTRSEPEFKVSHLPGAIWTGFESFTPEKVAKIGRDQPILVYCSVGYRSERIGEKLMEMGFTQVYNLYGGLFGWKNAGNKVVDTVGNPTEKVHAYNRLWGMFLSKGEKVYER